MSSDPVLAYQNASFLDSDDGRPLRILAEYLQPLQAFQRERVHDTVVFLGSARLREDGPLGRRTRRPSPSSWIRRSSRGRTALRRALTCVIHANDSLRGNVTRRSNSIPTRAASTAYKAICPGKNQEIEVQVSIYGPAPQPASTSLSVPIHRELLKTPRLPRAAAGSARRQ